MSALCNLLYRTPFEGFENMCKVNAGIPSLSVHALRALYAKGLRGRCYKL